MLKMYYIWFIYYFRSFKISFFRFIIRKIRIKNLDFWSFLFERVRIGGGFKRFSNIEFIVLYSYSLVGVES